MLCIVGDYNTTIKADQCAVEIGMLRSTEMCTEAELGTATDTLNVVLKALAHSLKCRATFEGITDHVPELKRTQSNLNGQGGTLLLSQLKRLDGQSMKVRTCVAITCFLVLCERVGYHTRVHHVSFYGFAP